MSSTGLDVFDTMIQETNHWLKIMMGELGTDDRRTAFLADHVAAQLPRQTTINPAEAARACFATMESCLDRGELLKLRGSLPHEVLNLFPDSLMR